MSKISDVRELTEAELAGRKNDLRQEYLNLRLQQSSGQLEKPHRLREIRRDVARVETALSEKRKGLKITSRVVAAKK